MERRLDLIPIPGGGSGSDSGHVVGCGHVSPKVLETEAFENFSSESVDTTLYFIYTTAEIFGETALGSHVRIHVLRILSLSTGT